MNGSDSLHDATTAARQLGVGRTTLYNLIKTQQIGTVRIGRRRLIPASEIEKFISVSIKTDFGDEGV